MSSQKQGTASPSEKLEYSNEQAMSMSSGRLSKFDRNATYLFIRIGAHRITIGLPFASNLADFPSDIKVYGTASTNVVVHVHNTSCSGDFILVLGSRNNEPELCCKSFIYPRLLLRWFDNSRSKSDESRQ